MSEAKATARWELPEIEGPVMARNRRVGDLTGIERAVGARFPRVRLPNFDYNKRPADRLEIPLAERIASIRARKAEDRQRARINAERRAGHTVRAAR